MQIRPLRVEDFSRGFFESLSNLRQTNLPIEQATSILQMIEQNPLHRVFVAEVEGQVVATATLIIEPKFIHNGGLVGHLEDVSTHPQHCGKGYGRVLIAHVVGVAQREGCYKIILDCDPKNVDYYREKCDFRDCGNAMRRDLQ